VTLLPGLTVRARRVQFLVMDVDGVLTDGRMILSERGDELKSFHVRDGVAIVLARRAGLRTAMVTGESSPIARTRGERLGVDAVVLGARRKAETVEALRAGFGLEADAVAYVGDDLLDIPALQRAGLAIAVADAPAEVKAVAHLVTAAAGGHGAIRECVELILRSQGTWEAAVGAYVRDHGGLVEVTGAEGPPAAL
jgi:3-deoxy-D-manno-octulosonate 8-phosphate phosphatase (KDO 8-P phosphatase)